MIQAKETYKEELSKHVEGIFKKYVKPGLHICDIATGGGKSYTIGKLTCEYYPKHFDRIVILCVQNKLVEGMNREIDRFIDLQDSLIKEDQKLYNPQIQISAESETKRSIFREKDKTKRSKKESAQHSKSRNKSFVMTSVSAL